MKKLKTNGIIALLAGTGILLMSIGHVAGREGGEAYTAPDLMLTQGQAEYDLCSGIKYNSDKYELSVSDEGGFDINAPGSYTVKYALTPVEQDSGPKETLTPKDPDALKETAAPQAVPGGGGGMRPRIQPGHRKPLHPRIQPGHRRPLHPII